MCSNDRRWKQADDEEKNKDYREINQEHKGAATLRIGIVFHI
jgi:hypothetical protein